MKASTYFKVKITFVDASSELYKIAANDIYEAYQKAMKFAIKLKKGVNVCEIDAFTPP